MSKLPIYLYSNTYPVVIDLDNNTGIIQVMYQRILKIQKGLVNKVQIQFKNSDQKMVNVSSSTFVFSMFDELNQRLIIEKDLSILDDGSTKSLRGLGELIFSESDTVDLEDSYYKFTIKKLSDDGYSYEPTYANTYYDIAGTIELSSDVYPVLRLSTEVSDFQRVYNGDMDALRYEYYSGNLRADPEFNSNDALHTLAVYMTSYKGIVRVEGTLENSPSAFGNYALIESRTYNGFSGIDYYNFNGVFSFIRVKYIPEKDPITLENDDVSYRGSVDKILYRS